MTIRFVAQLRSLWRNLARRARVERAMDDELREYVDLLAAENERAGMTPTEARRRALVATGGVEQIKEASRDAWVGNIFAAGTRELRYALRTLRRSPVFLIVAIAVLAIGIGGATAVFTVVNASLLRPLPAVADPGALLSVERLQSTRRDSEFSYPDYRDLREQSTALSGLAAFNGTSMALEDSAGSARAWVSYVTDNFFTVLGVQPAAGRLFAPADANEVVVLGHALWQRRFGGSPAVIGSTLRLNDHVFAIIGVAPAGFIGAMATHRMELFIPIAMGGQPSPVTSGLDLTSRNDNWLRLVGRMAPGKDIDQARRDLTAIATRLTAEYPTNRGVQVFAGAGMTVQEREEMKRMPRLLAMAVALLLLIACGNVAGLSLIRSAARRRELATRVALGASRAALVRQIVLEGAVVAVGAGLLGVLIAKALVRSATVVSTVVSMSDMDLSLDLRVLGVAIGASVVTAVLVSLLPAVHLFRISPAAVLKDGGGAVRRALGQRVLVAAQVGASLVLLSAAATVFGTFQRILAAHNDIDPGGLTYALLEVEPSIDNTKQRLNFYNAVLARAASEPRIASAAVTSSVPPLPWSMRASVFRRGEEPSREALIGREAELGLRVNRFVVSPDFFDAMRIPLLRGRAFVESDDGDADLVAIVSHRLADELWPGLDAVGQLLVWPSAKGPARPPMRVVGVAADTRDVSLSAASPMTMYLPFAQHAPSNLVLALRSRSNATVELDALRRIVATVNPNVAVLGAKTLRQELRSQVRPQRTASAWIGVFGAIALLLAAIGLYGVVAQGVLQRTRELAVRSALGATPRRILATVLGDGMRLAALGGVVGAFGAIAAFRVLRSLFTGVQAVDMQLASVAAALLAIAMLGAAYLPARRAARLNPVDALRSD